MDKRAMNGECVLSATFEKLPGSSQGLPELVVAGRTERNIIEQIAAMELGMDAMQEILEDYDSRRGPASLENLMRRHFAIREHACAEAVEGRHLTIRELDPYFPDDVPEPLGRQVLETEISKRGLRRFHEETGKYLVLTLLDDKSASAFDMDGTWPSSAEYWEGPRWEETGVYEWETPRKGEGDIIHVMADIPNLFDAINFFEAGRGFADMLDEGSEDNGLELSKCAPVGFDIESGRFVYHQCSEDDPFDDDDVNLLVRLGWWSAEYFMDICRGIVELADKDEARE